MSQETTITRRTRFGAKTEVLLGERGGDRALRLSDLEDLVSKQVLKVMSAQSGGGVSTGGSHPLMEWFT